MREKRFFQPIPKCLCVGLWLGLILLLMSCGSPKGDGENQEEVQLVPVKVLELKPEAVDLSIRATGVLKSEYEVPITPEISGTIQEKVRDIGAAVAPGDVILRLDAEPYELALAQAEAGFASAQVAHDQALRDYERAKELHGGGDISEFEMETAHLAKRTAEANLQMARAALGLAQRNERLTRLCSPIYGSVADLKAQIGQQVMPGTPLGLIVSQEKLEVEIGVSERDIAPLRAGNEAQLSSDVFPGRTFPGRVRSVGVAGLDLGKSFPVVIDVENAKRLLRPGMIVAVKIIYDQRREVISVPESALVLGAAEPMVYIVEGGMALSHGVQLGHGEGGKVIVESGLNAGDSLVIEGQNVLRDSVKVKIL